ncbi:MAG: insulinase family protein [Oscillospiraceae bacterium]|nr:insulinase family protein [Oscillospiraceae bacterium]
MVKTMSLFPGVTLRCVPDDRFKHGVLSLQLVRPMCREEAAKNALLPAVLLRGCRRTPDLRRITHRLDALYGASVGTLVRRVGDWQTTGLYCSFIEDHYAMDGEEVFAPMMALLGELLLEPVLENGAFSRDYVESEKKNLIATIASELNDKRAYAAGQLLKRMCAEDPFGLPRLGEQPQVEAITPQSLYSHYQTVLRESAIEIFYVGSRAPEQVAAQMETLLGDINRNYVNLEAQTAFRGGAEGDYTEVMDVNQGKLCVGYVTPITLRDEGFVAMQLLNVIFGGGMTSKLFVQIREKQSLCYAIGSGFYGSKGILSVSAGIDSGKRELVLEQIEKQLDACRRGDITSEELTAAKEALRSSLRSVHDSPGAIENYYASRALSGLPYTPDSYLQAVEAATAEQVAHAAQSLRRHTVYFLKGAEQ